MLVALAWILGLLSGAYILERSSFVSVLCSAHFPKASIAYCILSLIFPLLLSYILSNYSHFYCLLSVVFLKALSFMCCYGGLMLIFGNAGWLVSGIIFISDFVLVFMLLVQWFNNAVGIKYNIGKSLILNVFLPILIGCYDYYVVSPFVAMLLHY